MNEQIPQELQLFGKAVAEFHAMVDALSSDRAALLRLIITWESAQAELSSLRDALAAVSAQRDELLAGLGDLEWIGGDDTYYCPRCLGRGHHEDDCRLDALLTRMRTVAKVEGK